MKIARMFERDINRAINGVVKVNQVDDEIVFQELDEYVITRELQKHLRSFFKAYAAGLDGITDKIGIWISGFFGSGKSHFIKILSYLLENRTVRHGGVERSALDFFEDKIDDPLFLADIQRCLKRSTDVVLFNIDSRADQYDAHTRDTVLEVFVKVFNELQGYCAEIPELAEMERFLDNKGQFAAFKQVFAEKTGSDWVQERDAFRLAPDDALAAFADVTGQSLDSARRWYEASEANYKVSIDRFARMVKDYVDRKGKGHRVLFLVDEVGQYIGGNKQLMLNLQTIVEDLGVRCGGRAWVVVTSQEDIDAILGDMPGARTNDFSKIQGRFSTRLSLSSTNTDEVIKERLLKKTPDACKELATVYTREKDILKNQISFSADSATMKTYANSDDFVQCYPFLPYQFDLLQKVFESIRKVGASGAHLAKGERSMLDSFQQAVQRVQEDDSDILVPFHAFYPAIEGFLEGVVIRTIERAADNAALEPFDQQVLQVLFLVRYVNLIKANVENIATLCVSRIDEDKLALRAQIEESLARLEKQTLIQRSGDLYSFLTNEERDVLSEIKAVELDHLEKVQMISDVIYQDIFKDARKHRLVANGKDYDYNRVCDGIFRGNANAEITVEIVSPLNEDYGHWDDTRCIMETADGSGKVVFKLKESGMLRREVESYKRTEKYVLMKDPNSLSESVRRILQDHNEENRVRRGRIRSQLESLFATADVFVLGKRLTLDADRADTVRDEALEYLIANTYRKLPLLASYSESPADAENKIRSLLTAPGSSQLVLDLDDERRHPNCKAFLEISEFLQLKFQTYDKVTLKDVAERYARKPWGWPQWDTVLMVATLFRGGELRLLHKGELPDYRKAVEPLTKTRYWQDVVLQKQPEISDADRKLATNLVKECFHEVPPADGEDLADFIAKGVASRLQTMEGCFKEAEYAAYPTRNPLSRYLKGFQLLAAQRTAADLLKAFAAAEDELRDFAEQYPLIEGFHKTQKTVFEQGRQFVNAHRANSGYYDEEAAELWTKLESILNDPAPFGQIPRIKTYVKTLTDLDRQATDAKRAVVLPGIDARIDKLLKLAGEVKADKTQSNHALYPIQQIKKRAATTGSIDAILAAETQAATAFDQAWNELEGLRPKEKGKPVKPSVVVTAANLMPKPYLETGDDVTDYLDTLKQRLDQAIADGKRVQVQ